MKKAFKYAWLIVAMLTVGFFSCSKSDDTPDGGGGGDTPVEGVETTLYLSLAFPGTYATDAGTADESVLNTIDLFILNGDGSQLITHKRIDDGVTTSITVTTTSGSRLIFAGVNLPDEFLSSILVNKLDAVNNQTEYEVTVAQLTTEYGFTMFSDEISPVTLWTADEITADPSRDNTFTLNMMRMVGKVGAIKGGSLNTDINGYPIDNDVENVIGKVDLSTLEYTLGTVNKYTYAMQYQVNGIPQDPNHIGYDYSHSGSRTSTAYGNSDFSPWGVVLPGNYKPVADNGTNNNDLVVAYAPENTAELALQGSNTYASIKVQFLPEILSDDQGDDSGATYTPGDDFYMIVHDGLDDQSEPVKITKFFADLQTAGDYCTQAGITPANPILYEGGICYYTVYPGREDGYNFYRNTFYRINVTAINSIGNPDPDPVDPDKPIEGDFADITVNILVIPWTFVEEDHELGK